MADPRLTQSPRAIRTGNKDPNNINDAKLQLDMDTPRKVTNPFDDSEGFNRAYDDGGGKYSKPRKS